jgi:hypothetical protein
LMACDGGWIFWDSHSTYGRELVYMFGLANRLDCVGVAQLVECRFVVPVVAGSSPVTHPKKPL